MSSTLMAPPHSRREIEFFASDVRQHLGIDDKLCVPILHIAEVIIPQLDSTFNFDIVYDTEMPYEYANYCPETNTLSISQTAYLAAYDDDARQRFTIAHELGHYFIHDDITAFSRCPIHETIPKFRDPEWQANVFASSLLMSPKLIRGMTATEVSRKCKTSYEAAYIALKNIAKKS